MKTETEQLRVLIRQHIRMTAPALDPLTSEQMAISLSTFVNDAIVKFAKGQAEHGGRIVDRDLKHELYQELQDSFWYLSADKWDKTLLPPATKTTNK